MIHIPVALKEFVVAWKGIDTLTVAEEAVQHRGAEYLRPTETDLSPRINSYCIVEYVVVIIHD